MSLLEYTVTIEKYANMISTQIPGQANVIHAHLAVISLPRNIKETMKVKQVSNNEDTSNVWLEECKLKMNEGLTSDVIVPKEKKADEKNSKANDNSIILPEISNTIVRGLNEGVQNTFENWVHEVSETKPNTNQIQKSVTLPTNTEKCHSVWKLYRL